ncbi:hypothetical protein COLO4_31749 [Corchorus olitorius]|uniref:Uncharacterized protein n=1 Tax=Corchorus olitorius TaxID=93759 RepID=A0A1R3H3F0_9ROSI|nr:hypothetical protein COLO4_31749 [Corchorus olitorius]
MSVFVEDLIPEILLRLPVKALLRFRCVSKSLCHEINKIPSKLIFQDQNNDFYAIDIGARGQLLDTPKKLGNNPITERCKGITLFHGSCNDLLLLSTFDNDGQEYELWLWNFFPNKCIKLPDCPGRSYLNLPYGTRYGLGYDYLTKDYKVVQIQQDGGEIWVFSLASNTWRNLILPNFHNGGLFKRDAIFLDGALHWLCKSGIETKSFRIVTFDISKEILVDLFPPVYLGVKVEHSDDISLEVLEGVLEGGRLVLCHVDLISQHLELLYPVKFAHGIGWHMLYHFEPITEFEGRHYSYEHKFLDGDKNVPLQVTIDDNFFFILGHRTDKVSQGPLRRIPFASYNSRRASFCRLLYPKTVRK